MTAKRLRSIPAASTTIVIVHDGHWKVAFVFTVIIAVATVLLLLLLLL